MEAKIRSLRDDIDTLNLEILDKLSKRAELAEAIGELQTQTGSSHYDPVREQAMLDALTAANRGPFDDATVKSLFKQIFQASMHLEQEQDKKSYLTSRRVPGPRHDRRDRRPSRRLG
ncbi:MAG: chorismate mutase [Trueperaceae bacterium]|nr:chorismate mutase [Trueperaceae bacterium]